MAKLSLLAALALACVCSAVEFYTDDNYEGIKCIIATPLGECIKIPDPCYDQVSSMFFDPEWYCHLFDNDDCSGDEFPVLYNNIAFVGRLFNDRAKSTQCWLDDRRP